MLRKGIAVAALSACGFAAIAGTASTAKAVDNPFELTLSGSGSNTGRFNGFTAGAAASLGYYLNENLEVRFQQTVNYSDFVSPPAFTASSDAALDYNIPLGDHDQWVPFFGANIGYVYGKNVTDTWEAAPEAGVKYYVNSTTFIYGSAEYQFFFKRAGGLNNGFKEGQFVYDLGIGFRF